VVRREKPARGPAADQGVRPTRPAGTSARATRAYEQPLVPPQLPHL
jgi:hypothetical protein